MILTIITEIPTSAVNQKIFLPLLVAVSLMSACVPAGNFGAPEPTAAASVGSTLISAEDNMTLVYVPAGSFQMGSQIGLTDEMPVHTVELQAFWVDQTEVTNAQYSACVEAGACKQPQETIYYDDDSFADHPVVYVSWEDGADYCGFVGRRLPTEAEWEKAASWNPETKQTQFYPWGDEFECSKANLDDETTLDVFSVEGGPSCDGYAGSAPVGSYPEGASPYGALDMAGNVWEWVFDGFVETDPYNGSVTYYAISPPSDPTGPLVSAYRGMRGGSWNLNFGLGRSAYRLWFGPDDRYDGIGFRCALGSVPFELNP